MNPVGREVDVYFNLHKRVFSLRDRKTRRVIAHAESVELEGCEFRVSQAGRRRVLKEQRKNVHAVIRGVVKRIDAQHWNSHWRDAVAVVYNPYKYDSFVVERSKRPIQEARRVQLGSLLGRPTITAWNAA